MIIACGALLFSIVAFLYTNLPQKRWLGDKYKIPKLRIFLTFSIAGAIIVFSLFYGYITGEKAFYIASLSIGFSIIAIVTKLKPSKAGQKVNYFARGIFGAGLVALQVSFFYFVVKMAYYYHWDYESIDYGYVSLWSAWTIWVAVLLLWYFKDVLYYKERGAKDRGG